MYSAFSGNGIVASPISLLSMGGVCWQSLTPGKTLFGGRQTCSLFSIMIYDSVFSSYAHLLCPKKQSTSSSNLHRLVI